MHLISDQLSANLWLEKISSIVQIFPLILTDCERLVVAGSFSKPRIWSVYLKWVKSVPDRLTVGSTLSEAENIN